MYTVKEASEMLNLTEHAIRFYTDQGLVASVQRDKNNIRRFDEQAINSLNMVKCLKKSGMSIKNIKHYVDLCAEGDCTLQARYEIIKAQKKLAKAQLEEAIRQFEYLENKEQKYEELIAATY